MIAELHDENDQEFLNEIKTDDESNEINMDQMQANFLKTLDPEIKKTESAATTHKENVDEFATAIEFEGEEKGVFINSDTAKELQPSVSKNKNNGSTTPIRTPISSKQAKTEKMSHGNQIMQDFATKLSERLNFLKPIK